MTMQGNNGEEKLLPEGEAGVEVTALPQLKSYAPESKAAEEPSAPAAPFPAPVPSAKAQSWGTVIAIVVIVLMIVIGAFYAWGKRIAENEAFMAPTESTQ